jgi:quinol monooxygenase YgiN
MPRFIQTITYTTTRIDEVRKLGEEFRNERMAEAEGPKPLSVTVCADRDTPNRYTTVAEFASYEDAMANSNHPATSEFAQRMAELVDGPPVFVNLDVMEEFQP